MWHPPQGIHAFLRAYYHMKSADWKQNQPAPLAARTAAEWAKLPRYYVMDLDKGMAETVAAEMPSAAEIAANRWLPDAELNVYSEEYGRTGFQGGSTAIARIDGDADLQLFSGRTIDVPSMFIGGKSDWGVYQNPGALERLEKMLHEDDGHASGGRRRALGAAGAAGSGQHGCWSSFLKGDAAWLKPRRSGRINACRGSSPDSPTRAGARIARRWCGS